MNVWERAFRLTEAAAGSIIRLLGMHKVWAELFDREYGKFAFPMAKMVRMSYDTCPVHDSPPWSAEPVIDFNGHHDPLEGQMQFFVDETVTYLGFKDDAECLELLKRAPNLVTAINSMKLTKNKEAMMTELEGLIAGEAEKLHATQPKAEDVFLKLGQGWYWRNLRTSECAPEAQMMGHCGSDDRGTLFSLRDPNNAPHVTITYNEKKNAVYQIKGKQNKIPDRKYWPAVEAFFKQTSASLQDHATAKSGLGAQLQQYVPEVKPPAIVARIGTDNWIEDPQSADTWVLVPDERLTDFTTELEGEYHGFDTAWLDGDTLDFSAQDEDNLRPLLQVLRTTHPDLKIRGASPEPMYPGHVPGRGDPGGYHPQEELELEHARHMGPVAYAEAIARLDEDSRGNMKRLLGVNSHWADFFQNSLGKFSFPFAKICSALSQAAYKTNIFKLDPSEAPTGLPQKPGHPNYWSQESRERLEPVLQGMPVEEGALVTLFLSSSDNLGLLLHPWDPIESALRAFKKAPALVDTLSKTPKLDANTLKQLLDDTRYSINKNQNMSDIGEPVLQLAGGYEWRLIPDDDFGAFGEPMGNCGEMTGDRMYALLDKAGKAHVIASYDDSGLDQIAGYGNSAPKQKYKPMVMALAKHLGTGLARGEKSWGVTYGNDTQPETQADPQDVHEAVGGHMIGYHGSDQPIKSLSPVMDVVRAADYGPGMYFTTDPADAASYGRNVYRASLDVKNPLVVTDEMSPALQKIAKALGLTDYLDEVDEGLWHGMMALVSTMVDIGQISWKGLQRYLQKLGYDGIIVPNEIVRQAHAGTGMKGDYIIVFDVSQVQGWTQNESLVREFLTDIAPSKEEAIQMLSDIVSDNWDLLVDRGVDPEGVEYLGAGNNGAAWQLQDGRVLKITTDDAEAHVASHLRGKKFKHVFTVFDVWAFPGTYNGHHVYGLLTEGGLVKPSAAEQKELDDLLDVLMNAYGEEDAEGYKDAAYDLFQGDLRKVLTGIMQGPLDPTAKRQTLMGVKKFQLNEIMADMKRIGFHADLHSGNVMKRPDGSWVLIDIGTGGNSDSDRPPFLEDTDMAVLPVLGEAIDNDAFATRGIKLGAVIGQGGQGIVYDIGGGKCVKITDSEFEADLWARFIKKPLKHLPQVYDVFPCGTEAWGTADHGGEDDRFAVVMQRLRPLPAAAKKNIMTVMTKVARVDPNTVNWSQVLPQYKIGEIRAELRQNGIDYNDWSPNHIMVKPDGELAVIDLGYADTLDEDHLDNDVCLDEAGIQGPSPAGGGPQMRSQNSGAWSGGMHVLADPQEHVPIDDEDEEARYLDQDSKTVGPLGSNSPY